MLLKTKRVTLIKGKVKIISVLLANVILKYTSTYHIMRNWATFLATEWGQCCHDDTDKVSASISYCSHLSSLKLLLR